MTAEQDKTVERVAFIGSSPSSRHLAPFDKPEWEIWGCGPAFQDEGLPCFPGFPPMRWDRWFEIHDMSENDPEFGSVINPNYWEWLVKQTKPIYYRPPLYKELPGLEFPWDAILDKHGGYFLDSTPAWQMAFAYEYFPNIKEVGLYGIDFADITERQQQKKGCYHFIRLFKLRGVKVHIPEESDMSWEPPPYPDVDPLAKKLSSIENQLMQRHLLAEQTREQYKNAMIQQEADLLRIKGALEQVEYFKGNRT